jgi:hypothetical protein
VQRIRNRALGGEARLFHVKQPRGGASPEWPGARRGKPPAGRRTRPAGHRLRRGSRRTLVLYGRTGVGDMVWHRCCTGEAVRGRGRCPVRRYHPVSGGAAIRHPISADGDPAVAATPPTIVHKLGRLAACRPLRQPRQECRPGLPPGRRRPQCPRTWTWTWTRRGAVATTECRGRHSAPGAARRPSPAVTTAPQELPTTWRRASTLCRAGLRATHRMVADWRDDADPSARGIECSRKLRPRLRTLARRRRSAVVGTIAGLVASEAGPRPPGTTRPSWRAARCSIC